MSDWPADAPILKCPNGHRVTYWSQFVVGKPPRLAWHVHMTRRWVRDGEGWRRAKSPRRLPWRPVRMPAGQNREELPDDFVEDAAGYHAPAPIQLVCPVRGCGRFTTPSRP